MITDEKIQQIVQRIKENINPEKIVLFGSYASGYPTKRSDLDLCVVIKNKELSRDVFYEIEELLWGTFVPADIIVYSQEDIEDWKNVRMAFPTIIMRTGKILYEKQ